MNVNGLIISTLEPLNYPVAFNTYTGTLENGANVMKPVYITFNYADDRGLVFTDNEPEIDVASLQIHLFTPQNFNFMKLKKQIRSKLFKAGFSYPQVTPLYEDDTKKHHIIFECEIEGNSETEE